MKLVDKVIVRMLSTAKTASPLSNNNPFASHCTDRLGRTDPWLQAQHILFLDVYTLI